MRVLLLLFIAVPIIEMWLLITVGQQVGALATIGLVLLTALIGVNLLRHQGAMTLLKARSKMKSGEMPAREMADGLFFAVGGALLLTPGFVTDALGFACLTPGIRTLFIGFFSQRVLHSVTAFHQRTDGATQRTFSHDAPSTSNAANDSSRSHHERTGDVLEGDFRRHHD